MNLDFVTLMRVTMEAEDIGLYDLFKDPRTKVLTQEEADTIVL